MKVIFSDDYIILVLEKGEEIINSIKGFCKKNNISSGFINGIGAVSEVEIGYFDTKKKKYEKREIKYPCELLSLNGNITIKDEEIFLHLHSVIGNDKFETIGGHLFKGVISVAGEIYILKFDKKIFRKFDEDTKLYLIEGS